MFTNNDQTAKLIELGFEKPKNTISKQVAKRGIGYGILEWEDAGEEGSYSIGELMEMLPEYIEDKGATIDIGFDMFSWVIAYLNIPQEYVYCTSGLELIDALYDMVVKLKEEKII